MYLYMYIICLCVSASVSVSVPASASASVSVSVIGCYWMVVSGTKCLSIVSGCFYEFKNCFEWFEMV